MIAISVAGVRLWSRQEGWSRRHLTALAGGALVTYAWQGFPETPVIDASHSADLIGNGIFAALALILLVMAWRRSVETVRERSMVDATIRRDEFIDS